MELKRKEYLNKDQLNKTLKKISLNSDNENKIYEISLKYLHKCLNQIKSDFFSENSPNKIPRTKEIYSNHSKYVPLSKEEKQKILSNLTESSKNYLVNNLALISTIKKGLSNFSPVEQSEKELKEYNMYKTYSKNFPNKKRNEMTQEEKRKIVLEKYPPNPELKEKEKLFGTIQNKNIGIACSNTFFKHRKKKEIENNYRSYSHLNKPPKLNIFLSEDYLSGKGLTTYRTAKTEVGGRKNRLLNIDL